MSDIKLIIKDRSGKVHDIDAPTDMSLNLMEIIKMYELAAEGTIGICGGMAMCASCMCHIESDHEINLMGEEEDAMLSEVFSRKENSRLSCQIYVSEEMDGMKLEIAQEM